MKLGREILFPRLRLAPRLAIAVLGTIFADYALEQALRRLIPPPPFLVVERQWLIDALGEAVRAAEARGVRTQLSSAQLLDYELTAAKPAYDQQDLSRFGQALKASIVQSLDKQSGDVLMTGSMFDERRVERNVRTTAVIVDTLPLLMTAEKTGSQESMVLADLKFAIRLRNGAWLLVAPRETSSPIPHYARQFLSLLGSILIIALFSIWMARSIIRPLTTLAAAAERMGREREATPITGMKLPEYVAIADTFNEMQLRLKRFVDERVQMLAAISHDLRTPLTRLRLLAEYVTDPGQRAQILSDIADMEMMVSSSLAFMRDDVHRESAGVVDIAALLISLVDTFTDAGERVSYDGPDHADLRCRPVAIRRAFNNLIGNGCKYGDSVRVLLSAGANAVIVAIIDDGPGIPPDQLERAFQPFERLEGSRNRETGGTGLGLTIARDVIRGHGGDVTLGQRPEGFTARVHLPRSTAES